MIAGGRGGTMPCESCGVQFSVFKRKRICCECERFYCSGCLRRGGGAMCAPCRVLSTRPLYRNTIAHLKVRDLQCFLQRQNVSTRGCVEKDELVNLCVSHVNGATYRRRGARSAGAFSSLKGLTNNINDFLNQAFDMRPPAPAPPPARAPPQHGHPRNCFNSSHAHRAEPSAPPQAPRAPRELFTPTPGGEPHAEAARAPASRSPSAGSVRRDTADCFEVEDLDDAGWELVARPPADPLPNDSEVLLSTAEVAALRHESARAESAAAAGPAPPSGPDAGRRSPSGPDAGRRSPSGPDAGRRSPSEPDAGRRSPSGPDAGRRSPSEPDAGRRPPSPPAPPPRAPEPLPRPAASRDYLTPGLSHGPRARAASELELRPAAEAPPDSNSLKDELGGRDAHSSPASPQHVTLEGVRSAAELERLSVKQLKELLARNRVEFRGCLERRDLLQRAAMLWRDHQHYRNEIDNLPIEECCKICMAAPLECVLLECGHIAACTACAKQLAECPICRQYVVRAVRFFRS